jgi:hypothetical protein
METSQHREPRHRMDEVSLHGGGRPGPVLRWNPRWCMKTRVLAVIPASQWHMERAKAGLAILMPER